MFILGLNAFHGDSSACLLSDGAVVAAAEEERFRRIKHWAGFPSESIRYCLREVGIALAEVSHIAINHDSRAHLGRKLAYTLAQRPSLEKLLDRLGAMRRRAGLSELLQAAFPGEHYAGAVHKVEHHVAHLYSAFLGSSFEDAAVVSVDGFGDFSSAAWGMGRGTHINIDGRVYSPHSLGIFYQALTQFLGFPDFGDEYKMMGLASYGTPAYLPQMRRIVRLQRDGRYRLDLRYFRHHREKLGYRWDGSTPHIDELFSAGLPALLGPARAAGEALEQRHHDIACSAQAKYEEALIHLLNVLHARYRVPRLALAGGCAMNSVANGRIAHHTPFSQLYVPPAPGDAGGAMGAALAVWHRQRGDVPHSLAPMLPHAYWGPSWSDAQISDALGQNRAALDGLRCTVTHLADQRELCRAVAAQIADGRIVGWFQGRMEWGARALGNRSILCDPRRADMRDALNARIKRREAFRPFAPAVLRESVAEWFEQDADVPFMAQVLGIRPQRRAQIPAVVHVDGSGRLQTVQVATNPLFHALISAFAELTGVPMLLNTSFNEHEPIVCTPQQAFDCFARTGMDVLVMGGWLVRRSRE